MVGIPTDRGNTGLGTSLGFFAIAAISAAVILVEVSVTRILSFRLFYHFVYMVISTALLGLSAGASIVASRAARGMSPGRSMIAKSATTFAALTPVALFFMTVATPPPDTQHGKLLGTTILYFLPIAYLLLTGLFLCAGLIVATLFARFRHDVARLYFFDLAAAAVAAVAAVFAMKYFTPLRCFLAGGVLASLVGVALNTRQRGQIISAVVAALLIGLTASATSVFDPSYNVFEKLERSEQWKWDHQARVDLWKGNFVIDADASTRQAPLFTGAGGPTLPSINTFYEFPYVGLWLDRPTVAIIGAGGGVDIYNSLRHEAERVVAIELNQSIFGWMMAQPDSVYHKPTVTVIEAEGRHALRALDQKFELIQLSLIDTYTASAQGAYALTENFLYTVEAFEEYLDHLEPDGVLYISRWLFDTPRETLRLCGLGYEALRRKGIDHPERHMAIIGDRRKLRNDRRRGGFVLSSTPIDVARSVRIAETARRRDYEVLYTPDTVGTNAFHQFMDAEDKQAFYRSYRFRIDPVTDDRPFFFQHQRMTDVSAAMSTGGTGFSQVALVLTLLLALVLSPLIVLAPLRRLRMTRTCAQRRWVGVYFGCLGMGFMLVEIPMIQRFTLYLGHPTHALVTILSSLLVCAALGSLWAGRLSLRRPAVIAVSVVAAGIVVWRFGVPWLAATTIGAGFATRVAICLASVGALGVGLGLPLTLGIRTISDGGDAVVAWAWACNGAASVVAACLAMVLLVYLGFAITVLVGALCYAVAAVALARLGVESVGVGVGAHEGPHPPGDM